MSYRPQKEAAATSEIVTLPSGASYPKFLEPLTQNELALLDTYAAIKTYEKEAARIKAEDAKRRLDEADERYRAKVREREAANSDEDDRVVTASGESENTREQLQHRRQETKDENDHISADEEENEETKQRRIQREHEISKLRKDVEAARQVNDQEIKERLAAKQKEETLRQELLGERPAESKKRLRYSDEVIRDDEDDDDEEDDTSFLPFTSTKSTIKKKRINESSWDESKPQPSLIANIGGGATPVHDFSKKLGMSKVSLGGAVLFPIETGQNIGLPWQPPPRPYDFLDGCLELELADFDPKSLSNENYTLAIKFHVPEESPRFSINIAAPNNDEYNNILFHFNPRHFQQGGQLVINDRKQSIWGNAINVPLSTMPLMFGKTSCTLIVQINEEGFDIFVEGKHCARLEHRIDLGATELWGDNKENKSLFLQFPSSDDYKNPENWLVYRVWWGKKASMAGSLDGVAGANNTYSSVHPKKLFISKLSKLHTDPEVDLRRAELERAFRKYGGSLGTVKVSLQKDSTFAFVEVASEQLADLALVEMAQKYRVNRARRTKHEALMDERSAKEEIEKGTAKEGWD